MKHCLAVFVIFLTSVYSYSQSTDWIEQMQNPEVNFYTVQKSFEEYWKNREIEKGKGWKQFKRWEAFMEPRVFPEGIRPNPSVLASAYQNFKKQNSISNSGGWKAIGPFEGNLLEGIGRVNRVAFHPTNPQIIWAGTPAGGLWKSVDGGLNWATNTDLLTNLGISDIEIDPSDPSVMYIATGDRDGGDTYSYGVLKSIDNGQTWLPTGLSWEVSMQVKTFEIYINPANTNVLVALTSQGIYRSTDGGSTWTLSESGIFNSLVQKPGDPNTLYATTLYYNNCDVYKSTDNGISWTQINSNGLPANGVRRMELAVTADDPDYIYVLCGALDAGYGGIYRSTDNGNTWSLRSDEPNLMGWRSSGSDDGGQAWYDLSIAVDPNDKDRIYVGGVNIWRSETGGVTWQIAGHWTGDGAPYIHADIHHLIFTEDGSSLFAGCDGGVYKKTGAVNDWISLNDGMNITQYYKLGASATDTSLIILGAQDNGTDLKDGPLWENARGGDGMECAIDPKDPNVMYSSVYYGNFRKSEDRGQSFSADFNLPPAGSGDWVTPFLLDPKHPDTIYTGFSRIWRSFDGGQSFTATGPSFTNSNIDQLGIGPNHTNFIYFSIGNDLYRSDDHGSTFINVSSAVPGNSVISHITVSYENPFHVVITRSAYRSGEKVFESYDGGLSWKNISYNLPNIPVNCAVFEKDAGNRLYVGTDLGVYYIDDNFQEWQPFNAGLPNVIVNELEINYENRKIRAATYGRGAWESPLYQDISPPIAGVYFPVSVCMGDTLTLFDASFYHPDQWDWEISPPGYSFVDGTDAHSQNPKITFDRSGIFNVSLSSANAFGSDSVVLLSAFAVGGFPLPFEEDFEAEKALDKWRSYHTDFIQWALTGTSGNSLGATSAFIELYRGTPQEMYELLSPAISFVDHDSVVLSFDYAYSGTSSDTGDSLKVYVSGECSGNWDLLASFGENGSGNFVTATPRNTGFTPSSSSDWCDQCPEIDLNAYSDMESVQIKFVVISNGGNNLYLDNIQLSGKTDMAPVAAFSSLTDDLCALAPVQMKDQSYGSPSAYEWTFYGGTPSTSHLRNPQVSFPAAGSYDVKLKVSNALGSDSILKTSYIEIVPATTVELNISPEKTALCYSDTLKISSSALNVGTDPLYKWYINGSLVQEGSDPNFSFTGLRINSQVYATVEASQECAWPPVLASDTLDIQIFDIDNIQLTQHHRVCIEDSSIVLSATPPGGVFSGNGVSDSIFNPSVAGEGIHIITYSYTDPNGCSYGKQQTIRVDQPTEISFQGNPVFCVDEDFIPLDIARPIGGNYSGEGVSENIFFPDSVGLGEHTVYYTYDLGGCGSFTDSSTITVVSGPAQPVISYQNPVLSCDQIARSYQWFRNGSSILGATGRNYLASSNGMYTVRITDDNGCSSISEPFRFGIGLEDSPNAEVFKLYPNPVEDNFIIHLETKSPANASLYIYNNIGQLIMKTNLKRARKIEKRIDVTHLPAGIYTLSIKGSNLNISERFMVY